MVRFCVDRTEPEWGLVVAADDAGREQFPEPFTRRNA
jgi:hypothetical protein